MTSIDELKEKLARLKMSAMAQHLESALDAALKKNLSHLSLIDHLAGLELEKRRQNAIKLRFLQSKLLEKITIDQFDFHHHKSRQDQKARILNLLDLKFIKERMDVIMIGNPGTGKTFLSKCIVHAACNANVKALFVSAMDMINHLISAQADSSLLKKLNYYQSPELLAVDEIGYLSLGEQGSNLFFQVISARHQKKSTMLTTNLPFADWGKIFDSTTTATAIADRLVQNSEVLVFGGISYRRKEK